MESLFWPVALFALLLLALLATIVYLAILSSRSQQQSLTFLSNLQQRESESTRSLATSMQERLSSQLSESQQRLMEHLQVQTQEVMVALTQSVTQSTASMSSTTRDLAELVSASQAMIAAKDTMAYQTIQGSTFVHPGEQPTGPYTSVEDLAQADAERAAQGRLVDATLSTIMKMTGVQDDAPYPAAGTGHYLRPAADDS